MADSEPPPDEEFSARFQEIFDDPSGPTPDAPAPPSEALAAEAAPAASDSVLVFPEAQEVIQEAAPVAEPSPPAQAELAVVPVAIGEDDDLDIEVRASEPPTMAQRNIRTQVVRASRALALARQHRNWSEEQGRTLLFEHDSAPLAPRPPAKSWPLASAAGLFAFALAFFIFALARASRPAIMAVAGLPVEPSGEERRVRVPAEPVPEEEQPETPPARRSARAGDPVNAAGKRSRAATEGHESRESRSERREASAAKQPPEAQVRFSFRIKPRSAKVTLDGVPVRSAQLLPKSNNSHLIVIEARGYLSRSLRLTAEESRQIQVTLEPEDARNKVDVEPVEIPIQFGRP